jgi:hypothetical protein
LNDVAHYDFVDGVRINSRSLDCGSRGDCSKVNRAEVLQRAEESPNRRPCA